MTHTLPKNFKVMTGNDLLTLHMKGALTKTQYDKAVLHLDEVTALYHDKIYTDWETALQEAIPAKTPPEKKPYGHMMPDDFQETISDDLFTLLGKGAIAHSEYAEALIYHEFTTPSYHNKLYANWETVLLEAVKQTAEN